jgi:hypothetical protein
VKRRGRRVDATGRSIGDSQHVRLYRYELESTAYRSLSLGARALLVELKALFNGSNNGSLFMSVREAAKRLNSSKTYAADRLQELHDKGFIRPKQNGAFSVKCLVGEGRATSWILTEYPFANALPTKDFMRWRPDEIQNAVRPGGRTVRPGGHSTRKLQKSAQSVRPGGRFTPRIVDSRSVPADTVSLPREVA